MTDITVSLSGELIEHGHRLVQRVYYEDTDCGGVVYYANYLKYFERARTRYLEERGLSVAELMKAGRLFVVVLLAIAARMLWEGLA